MTRKTPATTRKPLPADPELEQILDRIEGLSAREVASMSGGWIGASTVSNWRAGKVRRPVNYTINAALRAAGFERVIRRIKK